MATRLVSVVIDARDIRRQADFWSALLGWPFTHLDDDEADVEPPGGPVDLVFVPVPEPKTTKNRLHLDLSSSSPQDQAAIVARAEALGARRTDVGQRDVPWVVLADPEGNEFCVLEPRPEYADSGPLAAIVVDTTDVAASAAFWGAAAGWDLARSEDAFASLRHPEKRGPWLEFLPADPKTVKNRVHLDVAPFPDSTTDTESDRLRALGATPIDLGRRDVSWTVLTDPQGGEFCVLSPR
jgi:catechol 2,3-dioxygenase-like lactoylglutathione lyase family enzyme